MLDRHTENGNAAFRVHALATRPEDATDAIERRYAHILVPTNLSVADRAALLLGFDLAAWNRAALTVLHVMPARATESVPTGLDAIGLLHQAAQQFHTRYPFQRGRTSAEAARAQVRQFLDHVVPKHLQFDVDARTECYTGDVGKQIADFAVESDTDLVILSAQQPKWWLPIFPPSIRHVMQFARSQVIVLRRESELSPKTTNSCSRAGR